MALSLQVPIRVSPEAEAYVGGLGLGRELDVMIEHTRGAVPRCTTQVLSL